MITLMKTGKVKSKEVKSGSRWGEHPMNRYMLTNDDGALDDNTPLSHYNFRETATIFMHKKIRIFVDPTNMFNEETPEDMEKFKFLFCDQKYREVHLFTTDTVLTLKKEIAKLYKIPSHRFYLAHGADCIEHRTIYNMGIKNDSTVHMHRHITKDCAIARDHVNYHKVVKP